MKLTIKDRLVFLALLPNQGSMLTLSVTQDVTEKIRLTSKEIEQFGIKETTKGITWDAKKEKAMEIDFNKPELDLIQKQIEKKDKDESISMEEYETLKKFDL